MHAASALFKQHFCTLLHFCWNTRTCEVAIIEQQNVLPETPPEMPFIINLSPATSKNEHRSVSECISLECCISILLKMSKTFFSMSLKNKTKTQQHCCLYYCLEWQGIVLIWWWSGESFILLVLCWSCWASSIVCLPEEIYQWSREQTKQKIKPPLNWWKK